MTAREASAAFTRDALYCVYPRAFSREGTLAAVRPRLDAIRDLGVSALWLLPIHPIGDIGRKGTRGSPYAVRDDGAVAGDLGTLDDLRELVSDAHARGLRVIIDFVANHTALDHVMLDRHPEWFVRDGEGALTRRVAEWSDVVDRRHEETGVRSYLRECAVRWVREAGIDGFRCDVAGMVPGVFWRELRAALDEVKPDHLLLAEWQDPELHTVSFHASYDWLFYRALRDTARGLARAETVSAALARWSASFPREAVPLRFLENHDEPRAVTLVGRERLPAYAALAVLSGGWPLLYNGQEIGATHAPSLFEAEPIDWSARDEETTTLYRSLLAARRRAPWGLGPALPVATDRPETVAAFRRQEGERHGLVVANLGTREETVRVDLPPGYRYARILGRAERIGAGSSLRLPAGEAWIGEGA